MRSCAPSHQPELSLPFLHGYSSLPCFFEIIAILNCPQVNVNRVRGALPRSFLSDLAPLCFTSTGNFSPAVSYPAWHYCVSPQQETFHQQFPIRLDTIAFHSDRKLFASSFLSDLTPLRFTPTGNFFASSLPHAMTSLCFTSTGNAPSCEIVKKNIGYTFPHVFRVPKRGFHSYIDFLLSIGHGQGMDSVFWLYPPFFFSFYKIWFS